jgi:hypothetical protein
MLTFVETLGFQAYPSIPVRYLSDTLVATVLVKEFNIIVDTMASVFLVELESFSHDNTTSLLDIGTECFSKLEALL